MFYSEAILSKKGPLAKVWLAAHWERKLSKAQFLQANIQSSVGAIVGGDQPPMALRLSGQLLLGVVRIYSRKARYLLEDCNEALVKIKMAFRPGMVDMPSEQAVASFNTITLADNITEFDILLPDPDFNIQNWEALEAPTQDSQIVSRPQDITLQEGLGTATIDVGLGRDDLFGQGFEVEEGRELDLGLEDDFRPAPLGDDSMDIEVGRDAQPELSFSIDGPADITLDEGKLGMEPLGELPEFSFEAKAGEENLFDDMDLGLDRPQEVELVEPPMVVEDEVIEEQEQTMLEMPAMVAPARLVSRQSRKRKLIVDQVIELPSDHISGQLKDTSDITQEEAYLPVSRKMMRLKQIQDEGAHYYLSLNGPQNVVPELLGLFTRELVKDQQTVPETEESREAFGLEIEEELMPSIPVDEPGISSFDFSEPALIEEETIAAEVSEQVPMLPEEMPTEDVGEGISQVPGSPVLSITGEQSTEGLGRSEIFDAEEIEEPEAGTEAAFSKSTVKTMHLLRTEIQKAADPGMEKSTSLKYRNIAGNATRTDAVKFFFELLVLSTKDVVKVKQSEPYGDIEITPKDKLFDNTASTITA
ncbi:sister chromatid cohesion protein 1 [Basidiobolus ranarum]|uniref:Sister chromatid cohesion protein 1 n=1 Tax=Basidiobolus ranarum TaxID=34480 RepID=A0ABR2WW81_9FUNG